MEFWNKSKTPLVFYKACGILCRLRVGWSKGEHLRSFELSSKLIGALLSLGKDITQRAPNPFPPFLSLGTFCNQKVPPPGGAWGRNWMTMCMGENYPTFPFRFRESTILMVNNNSSFTTQKDYRPIIHPTHSMPGGARGDAQSQLK